MHLRTPDTVIELSGKEFHLIREAFTVYALNLQMRGLLIDRVPESFAVVRGLCDKLSGRTPEAIQNAEEFSTFRAEGE